MNEKQLTVTYGPSYNPQMCQVVLNGVLAHERLTRNMARRAVHAAAGLSFPATVWDNEHNYGYRVYAKSARKLHPESGDEDTD